MKSVVEIYFMEKNIRGAWVVYGNCGIHQYYDYTKKQAKEKYIKDNQNKIFVNS